MSMLRKLNVLALRNNSILVKPKLIRIPEYNIVNFKTLEIVDVFSNYMNNRLYERNKLLKVLNNGRTHLITSYLKKYHNNIKPDMKKRLEQDINNISKNPEILNVLDTMEEYWIEPLRSKNNLEATKSEINEKFMNNIILTRNVVEYIIQESEEDVNS